MIEIPRGALTADEIAQTAEFFSFGTNDLTKNVVAADVSPRHRQCRESAPTNVGGYRRNPAAFSRPTWSWKSAK